MFCGAEGARMGKKGCADEVDVVPSRFLWAAA
jgi:hypothetical protein